MHSDCYFNKTTGPSWTQRRWETFTGLRSTWEARLSGPTSRRLGFSSKPVSAHLPRLRKWAPPHTLQLQPEISKSSPYPFSTPPTPNQFCPCSHQENGAVSRPRAHLRLRCVQVAWLWDCPSNFLLFWCRWGERGELTSATVRPCQAKTTKGAGNKSHVYCTRIIKMGDHGPQGKERGDDHQVRGCRRSLPERR